MAESASDRAAAGTGPPDSELPGPYPVGDYAAALRLRLREFARVQVIGELVNIRAARARVYFELRDATGALPCSAWRGEWDAMVARLGAAPVDGMQIVVGGGCDYYPGSATSSPGFTFAVSEMRVAGEGDLLARIERLRRQLDSEGLLQLQGELPRPALPRTIGVITGESGKARDDVLAGLARRGWAGRVVWAFTPVQDRHAAPAIVRALTDLAATNEVEVIIVARGGGSIADLLAFCDETLCRTVALLQVPVIASVGHHTDRTVIDDVAAVSCSTPTHAAEVAVSVDCARARAEHAMLAARLRENGRRAVLSRAQRLAILSRAPAAHLVGQRSRLHQQLREMRAGTRRRLADERALALRRSVVLARKSASTQLECSERRPRELERLSLALTGHDPQRTLERGYVLARAGNGSPVTSAAQTQPGDRLCLRFADGERDAMITER